MKRSRYGFCATSACSSPMACSWRPSASSASKRSSYVWRRSSSSRSASARPADASATSASAGPLPQSESSRGQLDDAGLVVHRGCESRALLKIDEGLRVQRRIPELDRVTRPTPDERRAVTVEELPQPRDVGLERVRGRGWWISAPDLVDEPLDRHDLTGTEQENCQDGALLRPAERNTLSARPHLEWPENAELHGVRRHSGSKPSISGRAKPVRASCKRAASAVERPASRLHAR